MKVVRLSALRTAHLYTPRNIPGTHFCYRLRQPQGHSAARRIMSMKNSIGTIGNQTHDLLACSAVPQPTAPLRAPIKSAWYSFLLKAEATPGHSAARRIISMKNSSGTIGNQTHDLLACSAVPQPTAQLRAPIKSAVL